MNQKKPSQDKELLAMIKRFEEMKDEGKILYLDAEQYEDIIEYYIFDKNFPKATEVVETALQIHPDNSGLVATRVALYIDEEKIKEARETINPILNDNSFHVRLIHAELLILEEKEEEAKEILDSFENDNMDEIDCLDIGILCYDVGFYEKAIHWFKKCLDLNSENEEAIANICGCYQGLGQYHKTIALYNKLIDKDPYSAEYWSGLGKSYFYMNQFDKAIEACDFALVSDEKSGEAYTIKGHSYYQLENYQESIEAYKEAWRLGTLETEFAPMFIAFSYIGMEEWDNAYEYIKKAIARTNEYSPVFPDLLINSSRCLFNMNKNEEAHSTLEFAQERFPDNVLVYIYNGNYYLKEGKRDKAIENFEKAITISSTADTWNQIAVWAMSCGDYELAKDAFDHVEELDPEYEDLPNNMAFVINKLIDDKELTLNSKMLKERLRGLVESGMERPESFDIEGFIQQARLEGRSESEISEMVAALEQLNDLLENFDIDQEEDETE
ncbi:lipopolysaccharide assembly protein LapB [Bacteroides sp. 51]|uniref:tetratricopeptide repeat protein n=1 Tax=Bacteroides sp. 51 TaxID=2302938 RepID=UPI0013D7C1ED|nr:CDC27 family protein [Bacteroides sp. 51]NDV84333.1 hypothetical protein [Bacteroides sp. 51]